MKEQLKFGSNWFSITHEFASYILENEDKINRCGKYTLCGDEVFLHSLIFNSIYSNNIYLDKDLETDINTRSNMRYIDWKRGSPYTFKEIDYEELIESDFLFARKFDVSEMEVVKMIFKYLTSS